MRKDLSIDTNSLIVVLNFCTAVYSSYVVELRPIRFANALIVDKVYCDIRKIIEWDARKLGIGQF